ncbi:MAG: AraC family transcriptional regulator [Bacilli bacterium]|nr:AraC family transcriptional regulator [Bacilli bacterium]
MIKKIHQFYYSYSSNIRDDFGKKSFLSHIHPYYEIYIFLSGEISLITENNIYDIQPNNCLIIKPFTYHRVVLKNFDFYERIVIEFELNEESIEFEETLNSFNLINLNDYPIIMNCLNKIITYTRLFSKSDIQKLAKGLTLELIILINNLVAKKNQVIFDKRNPLITKIINYINNNIQMDISLSSISKHFSYSRSYLANLFKAEMKISVMNYIRNKKIILADSLMSKGMKPNQVYYEVGFNDYSTFYRAYKKYFNFPPSKK